MILNNHRLPPSLRIIRTSRGSTPHSWQTSQQTEYILSSSVSWLWQLRPLTPSWKKRAFYKCLFKLKRIWGMRWKPEFCDIIQSPPLVVHPGRQTSPLHGGILPVDWEQASLYWKTMTHTVEKERMGKRRMKERESNRQWAPSSTFHLVW